MNNYAFEHMDEFVNLTGHGNVDIALSVLCFFKFGKVISLEKHQEDAEYLNDKWEHEFKLSLMSKKKGYELEMKREIEKNSFDVGPMYLPLNVYLANLNKNKTK